MEKRIIVIFCNKKDFFLTRICVASIRYYYPDVDIYLVKDYLNGDFNSKELEKAFSVQELSLGIKKFGWGTAKVHFILSQKFPGEHILILDSDIVFAGRFLEDLYKASKDSHFAICMEKHDNPYSDFVKANYYDYNYLNSVDPEFSFPGYFFNTGQLLVKTGILTGKEMLPYFDAEVYPFCNRLDVLPMPDQSLLNYFLPRKEQNGQIRISKLSFMVWIGSDEIKQIKLAGIKKGNEYPFLIHWAGVLRIPILSRMILPDVLIFFENYYYSFVPFGTIKKKLRKIVPLGEYALKNIYNKVKRTRKTTN